MHKGQVTAAQSQPIMRGARLTNPDGNVVRIGSSLPTREATG
jgi:hypothetical protein